jgi:hypothetical protein
MQSVSRQKNNQSWPSFPAVTAGPLKQQCGPAYLPLCRHGYLIIPLHSQQSSSRRRRECRLETQFTVKSLKPEVKWPLWRPRLRCMLEMQRVRMSTEFNWPWIWTSSELFERSYKISGCRRPEIDCSPWKWFETGHHRNYTSQVTMIHNYTTGNKITSMSTPVYVHFPCNTHVKSCTFFKHIKKSWRLTTEFNCCYSRLETSHQPGRGGRGSRSGGGEYRD